MPTSASPACQVCLSQDDVDCRFSLAIRNDQVDPQTRLPRILGGCFVLIKSTKIVQTADLCHGEPPVNSSFCKVELDRVQGCCINNSFDLLHIEISKKLMDLIDKIRISHLSANADGSKTIELLRSGLDGQILSRLVDQLLYRT